MKNSRSSEASEVQEEDKPEEDGQGIPLAISTFKYLKGSLCII